MLRRELPDLWPVSGVVATVLMWTPVLRHCINILGAREAGTQSILQMFADGYKVNVTLGTGGFEQNDIGCIKRRIDKCTEQATCSIYTEYPLS